MYDISDKLFILNDICASIEPIDSLLASIFSSSLSISHDRTFQQCFRVFYRYFILTTRNFVVLTHLSEQCGDWCSHSSSGQNKDQFSPISPNDFLSTFPNYNHNDFSLFQIAYFVHKLHSLIKQKENVSVSNGV